MARISDFIGTGTTRAAVQAALNTGEDVLVDGLYTVDGPVSTVAAGQRIHGEGRATGLISTGTGANANCIVLAHDDCTIESLRLTPGTGSLVSLANGWAVTVTGDRCVVRDILVRGHRRGGVIIVDANDCLVQASHFIESVVTQNQNTPEPQSQMGYDVFLQGSSSRNRVTANSCTSGCGTGIGIQTVAVECYANVITDNHVKGHPCYGIMLYGTDGHAVVDTIVSGNQVEDISGVVDVSHVASNKWFYGAGIYTAVARNFLFTGNRVKNTNSDPSRDRTGSDVPAAIGVSGVANGVISSNVIDGCYHGIMVSAGDAADFASDGVVVDGNVIRGVGYSIRSGSGIGIYIINTPNATVTNNRLRGIGQQSGIRLHQSTQTMDRFSVRGNDIANFLSGIETAGTILYLDASFNTIHGFVNFGIYTRATTSRTDGNYISSASISGIRLLNSVDTGECLHNLISGATTPVDDASISPHQDGNRSI